MGPIVKAGMVGGSRMTGYSDVFSLLTNWQAFDRNPEVQDNWVPDLVVLGR
jgi:hypothetical protein